MTSEISQSKHKLPITKNVRYFTMGKPNACKLLYVLHGYGQLANYFLEKFSLLVEFGYFIVAPEGMHRFYLEGTAGRVGASWMTKEERETDIEDNVHYLNDLHRNISARQTFKSIDLLGFSQGGATAARWYAQAGIQFNQLILWACVFPDDMTISFKQMQKSEQKLRFVVGDQDPYFETEKRKEIINFYTQLNFSIILYHGKHQIEQQTLVHLFEA